MQINVSSGFPWVKNIVRKVLKRFKLNASLSVVITDDRRIRKLNKKYRKLGLATDVLSFEMDGPEEGKYLGDIVVSLETVKRNSQRYEVPIRQELQRVVIHGVLHLLGFDHKTARQARLMRKVESEIIKKL